jgi:predicted enzyme related to lactoylglutathione lyase
MPTLRGTSILLGTSNPTTMNAFYQRAFDVEPDRNGWMQLGTLGVLIDPRDDVNERNSDPGRVVLNVDTDDASAVVDRLNAMMVHWICPLEQRTNGWFATFEDPDGNVLQILQLSDEYLATLENQHGTTAK